MWRRERLDCSDTLFSQFFFLPFIFNIFYDNLVFSLCCIAIFPLYFYFSHVHTFYGFLPLILSVFQPSSRLEFHFAYLCPTFSHTLILEGVGEIFLWKEQFFFTPRFALGRVQMVKETEVRRVDLFGIFFFYCTGQVREAEAFRERWTASLLKILIWIFFLPCRNEIFSTEEFFYIFFQNARFEM